MQKKENPKSHQQAQTNLLYSYDCQEDWQMNKGAIDKYSI